jgi:hypothetical protein
MRKPWPQTWVNGSTSDGKIASLPLMTRSLILGLVGIELMHMIRKKQMVVEAGEEGLTTAEQFYSLAA